MAAIEVPSDYGFVLLSAVSTFFVSAWLSNRVNSFRKAAKIPYPFEYASYEQCQTASPASRKAMHRFNCAQRGHQNFNENHVTFLGSLLITGLVNPRVAAAAGAVWSVNRVLYAIGYTNGPESGKGRYYGGLGMITHYVVMIWAAKVAVGFVMA
ncbi:membrane-associated proteins in eicosanoid and glutathione metabolism [Lentithecium fluviatile CBS 122367]|uniref:Membrane-associated proteins in eicosanoid and glutathione metabolism n=1 Tax=Lentithecium fluviatile CBS 122367 TaxID=1168545 RepID=A0A6G1II48_9PLEO|nr:membrane-associated proteins in eicosanoid and glutathione metabolism [Lentithecium fluviatile CBS 122367]